MFDLTREHCCATCEYSEEERSEHSTDHSCQLLLDGIESGVALAVYVDCAARCSCYECNENKFFALHGHSYDDYYFFLENSDVRTNPAQYAL